MVAPDATTDSRETNSLEKEQLRRLLQLGSLESFSRDDGTLDSMK
jgi:hypothetical protein